MPEPNLNHTKSNLIHTGMAAMRAQWYGTTVKEVQQHVPGQQTTANAYAHAREHMQQARAKYTRFPKYKWHSDVKQIRPGHGQLGNKKEAAKPGLQLKEHLLGKKAWLNVSGASAQS